MLPRGVTLHRLEPHADDRGMFTELFRESWELPVKPVQWNIVQSHANVLRGVHAHVRHVDFLTVVAGRATIALHDLRADVGSEGRAATVELTAADPRAIVIPTGVAHGFYFHEPSVHVYSVSREWEPADELGCRWDDPELGIDWPCSEPIVSERDRSAATLGDLRNVWQRAHAAL